ncbi:flippase [Pectobacterium versatile]|uniref:flippase n=1 Tax=Pectobacterium versatile TaxID=2488639 RepID=UPI001B376563|nr:flippase [Pectobacterium versatile]MBQ4776529.1 oligosaccharide flippase family protein [Pectobacterium versatile]
MIKNIFSLIGIQGANFLIPLITLPYLVRVLEPSGYGILAFVTAIVQYFSILTDYGFNLSITKKISIERNNKKKISELFWTGMCCKLILFCMGFFILVTAISFNDKANNESIILLSAYIGVLGTAIFPMWLFQGKEKMIWIAFSNIIARFSIIPFIFVFVKQGDDVWIAALINGISSLFSGVVSLIIVYKEKWVSFIRPTKKMIKNEFIDGWYVFISTVAVSLYTTSTTVILGIVAGPIAVGYYVAADKIRQAIQSIISPISQVFYPRISHLMSTDKDVALSLIKKLLYGMTGLTFLAGLFLFFFSDSIIHLAYGQNYEPSIFILKILAWLPFIISFSNIFGVQTLLVLGYKKQFSCILIFSGTINILLLCVLAIFYQQIGAAISIFITEALVSFLMLSAILKVKIPLFKR